MNKALVGATMALGLSACTPDVCTENGVKVEWGRVRGFESGASAEDIDACRDALAGRDCSPVRAVGLITRQNLLEWYTCNEIGLAVMDKSAQGTISRRLREAVEQSDGDCSAELATEGHYLENMVQRIQCDDNGNPYEKLSYGEYPLGRTGSPSTAR